MQKNYKFGKEEYAIEGTEELHNFIDKLINEKTELEAKLANQPSLSDQLALWDKAKPYFEKGKKDIDYNLPPLEVMKYCLSSSGYDVEDIDEQTAKYVFYKVLKSDKPDKSDKSNRPNVVPTKADNSLSSEDMGNAWLVARQNGSVTALKQ